MKQTDKKYKSILASHYLRANRGNPFAIPCTLSIKSKEGEIKVIDKAEVTTLLSGMKQ